MIRHSLIRGELRRRAIDRNVLPVAALPLLATSWSSSIAPSRKAVANASVSRWYSHHISRRTSHYSQSACLYSRNDGSRPGSRHVRKLLGSTPASRSRHNGHVHSVGRQNTALEQPEDGRTRSEARNMLHPPSAMDVYGNLIRANVERESGSAAQVARILGEIAGEGLEADSTVQHDALKALAVHPDALLRGQILEEMHSRWNSLSVDGWHDVVAGLVREGQLEMALERLDDMRQARIDISSWLYEMMLYTLCDSLELDEAVALIRRRAEYSTSSVGNSVWFYLFDAACESLHLNAIQFVWRRRVEALYLNPTSGQCMQVLNAAASGGDVMLASSVFKKLKERDMTFEPVHYEMLMRAYRHNDDLSGILSVTSIIDEGGLTLHSRALEQLSNCLAKEPGQPKKALSILSKMSTRCKVPTPAFNCLIEASVLHGNLDEAVDIYKELHRICADGPNVETFNALFLGCRKQGAKEEAMFFAAEMVELQIRPNTLTYDRLLLVCLQERDYEDAFRYYAEMRETGFEPRIGTWMAMIQRTAEEGDGRAWDLVNAMNELGHDTYLAKSRLRDNWNKSRSQQDTGSVEDAHSLTRRSGMGLQA